MPSKKRKKNINLCSVDPMWRQSIYRLTQSHAWLDRHLIFSSGFGHGYVLIYNFMNLLSFGIIVRFNLIRRHFIYFECQCENNLVKFSISSTSIDFCLKNNFSLTLHIAILLLSFIVTSFFPIRYSVYQTIFVHKTSKWKKNHNITSPEEQWHK